MLSNGPYSTFYNAQGRAYKSIENAIKEHSESREVEDVGEEKCGEEDKLVSESVQLSDDKDICRERTQL